jgi:hypothetical protein
MNRIAFRIASLDVSVEINGDNISLTRSDGKIIKGTYVEQDDEATLQENTTELAPDQALWILEQASNFGPTTTWDELISIL